MLVCKLGYLPTHDNDYCPTTIYGESKMVGEQIVRNARDVRFAWVIVRITSIWGPWFEVPYRNFFDAIEKGSYFHPKSAHILRSFGYVGNTVYELEKLATASVETIDRSTLYVADYPPTEVLKWARIISREMKAPTIREAPLVFLRLAAIVGDACKRLGIVKNPPLTTFRLNNLLTNAVYDLGSLRKLCGDLPYGLEEGVNQTVKWLRAHNVSTQTRASPSLQ